MSFEPVKIQEKPFTKVCQYGIINIAKQNQIVYYSCFFI